MKEPNHTKALGHVTASPAQFLVHQRLGRTRFLGRGVSVFTLPWIDRYWLIPSSVQSVSFCADQITAENQGVEISGFAIWNIQKPEKAVEAVDFNDPAKAVERIGGHLREVVESAIFLRGREKNRREAAAPEHALLDMEQSLAGRQFELDQVRASNRQMIAGVEDAIERTKIAAANTRNTSRILVENLPSMLAGVKIEEMHLGEPVLIGAISRLTRSLGGGKQTGGNK
jgi:hypothetical protein